MDELYKNFCMGIHSRLKSTINASIKCTMSEESDKMYVNISRLGIDYTTSVEDVSDIIRDGEEEMDKCFSRIVKNYRGFINHKFFY